MTHACNLSTQEAGRGELLWITVQSGLYNTSLTIKKQKQKKSIKKTNASTLQEEKKTSLFKTVHYSAPFWSNQEIISFYNYWVGKIQVY